MDKIEVTQNARQAAFDAYLTCYESVPNDIWLQALLDGKHDGDEMVQAFARFERDILDTRTDATPVATDVAALVEAAKAFQHYGCPVCSGDCGSANPPVMACPMQDLSAAIAPFTKGQP